MFFKSLGLRLLLATLLVLAQQQAVLHLLGHSFEQLEKKNKDAPDPHQQVCAKCLALAHPDHALGGAPAIALPEVQHVTSPASGSSRIAFTVFYSYRSRAPPVFS